LLGRRIVNNTIKNEIVVDDEKWKTLLGAFTSTTYSGETVTAEGSFTNLSYVFACINIRCNAFSKLPLQLFKHTNKGNERERQHRLVYLMGKRPNKYQTPSQFKKFIEASLMLWGNSFILQEFDNFGFHTALKPLVPSKVTIQKDNNGDYWYEYRNDKGELLQYCEDEIAHIPYTTLDGKVGKAPLTVARENIGNLQAIQRFEGNFYKNGALVQGALTTQEELGEDEITTLQNMWATRNAGGNNAGKIPILPFGLDFKDISMPLKDAEFIMSKKMNQIEIANIFNVPVFMLNDMEKATFNNFEQMKLLFGENCMLPDVIACEEEFNYKFFTLSEQNKYYVKFNMSSALRGDMQSRVTAYKGLMEIAGITPNEIREKEDFNKLELPEADEPYMTRNLSPLKAIKDNAMGGGGGGGQVPKN
jgi:HK97 family phage portal protein